MKKLSVWFRAISTAGKALLLGIGTLAVIVAGAASHHSSNTNVKLESPASSTQLQPITTKTVTETKDVPFESSIVDDPTVDEGTTVTKVKGVDGIETITYKVTYKDGQEANRTVVSDELTVQPVNEVIAHGTKIPEPSCPNGSYVNSSGDTVCSPYQSPSVPAGATAQCADGTYSFSQHRNGTCSHHGGVALWL